MPVPRSWSRAAIIPRLTAVSAAIGAAYSEMHILQAGGPFALRGAMHGALVGGTIAAALSCLEVFALDGRPGTWLRRTPFLLHVALKTALYLGVILVGLALGAWVFPSPGEATAFRSDDVLFSLALAFAFAFMLDVNSLLGQNVLLSFVTGRYYRPRLEERVLLFLDMEGSTGWAERLGPLAFHRLVNRFMSDLTGPIVSAGGEIYSYVGDEMIATWRLAGGLAEARCVAACFDALDELTRLAPDYAREFGGAVKFRAGLHCGSVVAGEMGTVKKEIVLLGDAVNTAARIQELCRETGDRVLASANLIDRLQLPPGVAKRSLGDLRLRGKRADLALYALTKGLQESRDAPVGREAPRQGDRPPAP